MPDFKRAASVSMMAALVMSLAACAAPYQQGYYSQGGQGGYSQPSQYAQGYGTVTDVQMVRGQGGVGLAGAVVGGAVGGLAGNQVGKGSGRALATIAGLAAGAMIGNAVEQNATRSHGRDYYRVTVRLDNGQMHSLDYADAPIVRVGDRVRLDGNQLYR